MILVLKRLFGFVLVLAVDPKLDNKIALMIDYSASVAFAHKSGPLETNDEIKLNHAYKGRCGGPVFVCRLINSHQNIRSRPTITTKQ